jgi:transcriptional regulator with XRE-family HTH domain
MARAATITREEAAFRWRRALGEYIRSHRVEAGLTQADLAERVDIDNIQMISAIETGRVGLPRERYALFADALGISHEEFGRTTLRWIDPWMFALLFGMAADPTLRSEITFPPGGGRLNQRRGPAAAPQEA